MIPGMVTCTLAHRKPLTQLVRWRNRMQQTQAALQNRLAAAVANQRRLAAWHGLQAALTAALGYGGALIAYCSVGLAIFRSAPLLCTAAIGHHFGPAAEVSHEVCFLA